MLNPQGNPPSGKEHRTLNISLSIHSSVLIHNVAIVVPNFLRILENKNSPDSTVYTKLNFHYIDRPHPKGLRTVYDVGFLTKRVSPIYNPKSCLIVLPFFDNRTFMATMHGATRAKKSERYEEPLRVAFLSDFLLVYLVDEEC